jgi:hypothetical protein
MKRIATLVLACLVLAACFKSERLLLERAKAVHPMPEGAWTASDTGEGDVFTLTTKDDHYLRVEGDKRFDVVLVPLRGRANTFAAAESGEGCTGADATPECNWEYAIVVVEGDSWRQLAPNCKEPWDGMERDVAKREDDGETCWFDDPAGLEHALLAAAERGGTEQVFRRPAPPAPAEAAEPAEPAEPAEATPAPVEN